MGAAGDLSSPVPWEKALYSELPKPTRIGHSIGHWVQKLLPDSLTIPVEDLRERRTDVAE